MRYPPRLGHLATRSVVVAKLAPTFARAHLVEDDEAVGRLNRALNGTLLDDLLEASWNVLVGTSKRLDEAGLLEKIAQALKDRPMRPGKVAEVNPAWSAFLILLDLEAGTAADTARRLLETDQGQQMTKAGLAEVGKFLAAELTRK